MKPSIFTKAVFSLAFLLTLGFGFGAGPVQAQTVDTAQTGLDTVGTNAGLSSQDPTITVAKIIRDGLAVLGIVAVVILMYGGFVWMTAGGNEEKVSRAKKIILNAGIGLFIIFFSLGITQFVLQSLINATGGTSGGTSTDGGVSTGLGGGTGGVFSITSQSPTGQSAYRNLVPQIIFNKNLDATTITSEHIKFVYTDSGIEIPGTLAVTGNRVSFVPATPCPDPDADRGCFDENAAVNVTVSTDVLDTTETALSCANNLCTSSFIAGSLIDTEDPVAQLELPDDGAGVSSESLIDVQASATDDAQVAVADFSAGDLVFDSVPATGDDLTDVLINTLWDTAGLQNGSAYTLTVTVYDIAGNSDTDSITVNMRPATCFDTAINGIETGLNCGGDSTSPDYCGACDGSSCSANSECSSGLCENGVCTTLPMIVTVTPPDGAPGTWVTLSGTGFGVTAGTVTFSGADGPVTADLAACSGAWSSTQVIVAVPEGAVDGPITLTTASGAVESTSDDNGQLIADFFVNDVLHPGLCSLSATQGTANDAITLSGQGFGADRGSSTVTFGTAEAGSYNSWSDVSAGVTIPSLPNDTYAVAVAANGIPSNALNFTITSASVSSPSILSLSPSAGGKGQYVTITGLNFGTGTGTVWFEDPASGERVLADTESFPDACASDYWSDQEITVIVPQDLGALGLYNVIVVANGQESAGQPFTLTDDLPTPGLCNIDPPNALAGDVVTLSGGNFGVAQGSVTFTSSLTGAVQTWSDAEITVTVPDGALTGLVTAANADAVSSNPVNFEVSDNGLAAAASQTAAYAWSFSSGLIPDAPALISACTDSIVSGVPNDDFDNGPGVCVNAAVFVEFTLPMDEASLKTATLEECTAGGNNPCASTVPVAGTFITTSQSVRFDPLVDFKQSTTYRVTVGDGALSSEGAPLSNPSSWTFTTREDTTPCKIEKVLVSPDSAVINTLNGTKDFAATPVTGCTVLKNVDNYSWKWTVDPSVAHVVDIPSEIGYDPTCTDGNSTCALMGALAEGETTVRAKETASGFSGDADLIVDFSDPYITNFWPDCTEACVNAEVGASFNTAMKRTSGAFGELGVEQAGAVTLYSCSNELCTSLTKVNASVACTYDANQACTGFQFKALSLTPLKYYRVIVSGDVVSTSGVALTRTNYAGSYSWTFRVREDGALCAVDRISIAPVAAIVDQTGAQQTFTGEAYGAADSCSVSGQRLSGFTYDWAWTDPIANLNDQDFDNNPLTHVAEWVDGDQTPRANETPGNVLVDTNINKVPEGCTASCTAAGSLPEAAICGDGVVSYGEECDDGGIKDGDGCSASCLREGNATATCGNGVVNHAEHEDCDDGNTLDHDGCSSLCLAEGSSAVGATCGNGDVAVTSPTSLAGEECDDGNAVRGDGCSNECLWEGSPTLDAIGGAICGNGDPESPAEECDDGNTLDGDGCSSSCLLEGSTSSCGIDGLQPELGEACDDGNTLDGDGCSSNCLLEGSSSLYASPSFCGDGFAGVGELSVCEGGVTGDGNIDPVQVAFVPNDAVYEVDPATQQAGATIEVTEPSSGLSTSASLTLMCSAENDNECSDPQIYGVGTGNCCSLRPVINDWSPKIEGACRNAALYAIFSQEMNINDFTYTVNENGAEVTQYHMYARLDLATAPGGVCPADHTTLAVEPRNLVLKLWNKLVRFVAGRQLEAATGDCVLPIVGFEQTAVGNGTYKVQMHAGGLMVAGGTYDLVVDGDDAINDTDTSITGVTSKIGVGMNGTFVQTFTVGDQICALDTVNVLDTDSASPYVFTQGQEQHTFIASGISHADNGIPQEIDSIAGVYAWTWGDWRTETGDDSVISVAQDATQASLATVTAAGQNGDDAVLATATITDNATNLPSETAISGNAPVTAFLCENPWPSQFSQLPWSDTPDGDIGAEVGAGWMNFSTMYCRDGLAATANGIAAGPEAAGPELVVVRPPVSASAGVIKEYLFEVAGTADAIGVRIVSNPGYLSPMAWYTAQGFTGSPSETDVDGYQAVQDGRTTYVTAPNQTDTGDLYSNIYVISYNEGASDQTIEIYNQILENFKFAVNVSDVAECAEGDLNCASPREYLSRDTRRLTDITDLRTAVIDYKTTNGVVPTLPAGSFVRALSSSAWESWDSILGGALGQGSLPADPLNSYASCGGAGYETYNADTCVNEQNGTYVCPVGSETYHYKSIGDTSAVLYADLEYATGTWVNPINNDTAEGVTVSIGNSAATADGFEATPFCDGTSVYGASTTCGDSVVGDTETCELGQLGGDSVACTTDAGLDGTRSQVCNDTCSGYVDNTAAVCVVASCGNGVLETAAGEECDDGSLNGVYGFCGNDCTRDTAFFCGDGELAGGEACDCGIDAGSSSPDSRAYGAGSGSCGVNVNGVYAASPNASCAWDCHGPAAYCGDGTIDSGEVCDGADATYAGKVCSLLNVAQTAISTSHGLPCTTDAECGDGVCGGAAIGAYMHDACPVGQTRIRTCDDTPGGSCTYEGLDDWSTHPCVDIGSCGDGTVDPDEACDDGNTDPTDSCTDSCTLNICGDGKVFIGQEQCDEGINNGAGCDAAYGSSCTACSLSCHYEVSSGDFCGDGEVNGGEYCDANDIPYTYYNAVQDTTYGNCSAGDLPVTNPTDGALYTCVRLGVCNGNGSAYNGTYCTSSANCGGAECVMPTCAQSCTSSCPFAYATVPMELTTNQPGAAASELANFYSFSDDSTSQLPNAATITVPACNAAESLSADISLANVDLPTTYVIFITDLSYTMGNVVGDAHRPGPDESSRLELAQASVSTAARELYDKFGDKAQIASIGYRGLVAGQCFNDASINCSHIPPGPAQDMYDDSLCAVGDTCNTATSSLTTGVPYGYESDFLGPESEDELVTDVNSYTVDALSAEDSNQHVTFTYEALIEAKEKFDAIKDSAAGDNARYIAILLSDGQVTDGADQSFDPLSVTADFDSYIPGTAGYELYTANLSSSDQLPRINHMKNWSSNSYDGLIDSYACDSALVNGVCKNPAEASAFNGLDYAYNADTDDGFTDMYTEIVDSIESLTVKLISETDGDVAETSAVVQEGTNVQLPWPENFVCDNLYAQQVPIQITFPGIGQVQVSNVKLNYCAP